MYRVPITWNCIITLSDNAIGNHKCKTINKHNNIGTHFINKFISFTCN